MWPQTVGRCWLGWWSSRQTNGAVKLTGWHRVRQEDGSSPEGGAEGKLGRGNMEAVSRLKDRSVLVGPRVRVILVRSWLPWRAQRGFGWKGIGMALQWTGQLRRGGGMTPLVRSEVLGWQVQ